MMLKHRKQVLKENLHSNMALLISNPSVPKHIAPKIFTFQYGSTYIRATIKSNFDYSILLFCRSKIS